MHKNSTDYLKLFQISKRRYVAGIFQEGITVYKQQVRILNLLYVLFESNTIKKGNHIAIIGGGVAGLTLASAALRAGLKVSILEQKGIFLHVQYGCETRRIHPNIYDWPSKESSFPYADIPVLSWKANTAANVSKQLFSGYKKIALEHRKNLKNEIVSCKVTQIVESDSKVVIDWQNHQNHTDKCDILVYATGYGIEDGVDSDKHMTSYWRNDDFSQLLMPQKSQKYIISGIGDGGFIDLFRLKIFGYSIDSVVKDLVKDEKNYLKLLQKMEKILEEWPKYQDDKQYSTWLYEKFESIDSAKLLEGFKKILSSKLRKENLVELNGRSEDVKEIFNLNRTSLLNALTAYSLFKIRGFSYKPGECVIEDSDCKISGTTMPKSDIIIFRHGTDRESILKGVYLTDTEIDSLKERQKNNYSFNIVTRMWPFGWWSAQFTDKGYKPRIEFFTPDTQSVCSSYVGVLSKMLEYFHSKISESKRDFRATLHRIIMIGDEYFFQQITPYYGTRRIGEVGRVFPIEGGTAGFSARTGKTVIMERKNNEDFDALDQMFEFNKTKARILSENVSSLLTMPIFGKLESNKLACNLILYIDSSENDFFENDVDIMPLILRCTSGFIDSINSLLNSGNIYMAQQSFDPLPISENKDLEAKLVKNQCFKDISKLHEEFDPQKSVLKFDQFHSFNIITEHEHDPFQ